ncbi:RpiB/LacA/LacB family sugar-phosphate isomerase [Candidatus Shapirobacteria bacterium]|nr:RpiB/LacA/LacB family sugar-phosphate isomerase [Candidatus Shapirobacteria bacterium]
MVYLGADHLGWHLKEKIAHWLRAWNFPFEDLGNKELDEEDDYPDWAARVAQKVSKHEKEAVGIVVCGSGVGADIVANKFPKIRCGLGFGAAQIKSARADDDINVLALPADFLSDKKAKKIVEAFLQTEFEGAERQKRRISKVLNLSNVFVEK